MEGREQASRNNGWPLGRITKQCEFENITFNELEVVYAISFLEDYNEQIGDIFSAIQQYERTFLEVFQSYQRIISCNQKDEVAVFNKNMQLAFLPKESVQLVSQEEWENVVLSLLPLASPGKSDYQSSLAFYYQISPVLSTSVYKKFLELVSKTIAELSCCPFDLLHAKRSELANIFFNINGFLGIRKEIRKDKSMGEEDLNMLEKAHNLLGEEMKKDELLFLDKKASDFLITRKRVFNREGVSDLFILENRGRIYVTEQMKSFLCRYHERENFLLNLVGETFPPAGIFVNPKLSLLTALDFIRLEPKSLTKMYFLAFAKLIHLHPVLLIPLEEEEDFKKKFFDYFHLISQEKEVSLSWDELMNDIRVSFYLNSYYLSRRVFQASIYKELCLSSLVWRPFGELGIETSTTSSCSFKLPEEFDSNQIIIVEIHKLENLKNSEVNLSTCLEDYNEEIDAIAYSYKEKWQENGQKITSYEPKPLRITRDLFEKGYKNPEILKEHLINLLVHDEMNLASNVAKLLNRNEDNALTFYNILKEANRLLGKDRLLTKIWNTGAWWHVLLKCYEKCEELQNVFRNNRREIAEIFSKTTNSTMSYGTLCAYFSKLKPYFDEESIKQIKDKLEERKRTQLTYTQYFSGATDHKITEGLKKCIEKFPFCYFGVMTCGLLEKLWERGQELDIQTKVNLFRNTLYQFSSLRYLFFEFCQEQMAHALLNSQISLAGDSQKLFILPWHKLHAEQIIERPILEYYHEDTINYLKNIGEGGQAIAKLAEVPGIPESVIAKIFPSKYRHEMAKELDFLMKIQFHPHVIHIFGYIIGSDNQYNGILMENCEGGSLAGVLKDGNVKIDEQQILNWSSQAASGLMFLHKHNVIHIDVKPDNMLLDGSKKNLKISDMGVTKLLGIREGPISQQNRQLIRYFTVTMDGLQLKRPNLVEEDPSLERGQIDGAEKVTFPGITITCDELGTPGYIAPEIFYAEKLTSSIDVFSMGRSMWHMIYRRYPTNELVDATVKGINPTDNDLPPVEVSEEFTTLMTRMMDNESVNRPLMKDVYQTLKDKVIRK